MIDYDAFRQFARLIQQFHMVERVSRVPGMKRRTNSAEHSYQVSMLAWYAVSAYKLPLDLHKVLMYALAHDLIEVYAGDTYLFDSDAQQSKHAREVEAAERIEREFPEFKELHNAIKDYEKKADEESRFVYALDKLVDPLDNAMMSVEEETIWKEMNISYDDLRKAKDAKIAQSEYVAPLWQRLLEDIEKEKGRFFSS